MAPLSLALKYSNESIIRLLLKHKAEVDSEDGDGNPPLFVALNIRKEGIIKLLLEHKGRRQSQKHP